MTKFRNAYHFVPREKNTENDAKAKKLPKDAKDFGLRQGHESEGHAIYALDAHSGRITCTITLECPTIIGGQRDSSDKKSYAKVAPFMFADKPAIPASSLKGMLSLIAEAAARAPYRVLRDMNLTVAYSDWADSKSDTKKKLFTIRHRVKDGQSHIDHSSAIKDPKFPSEIRGSHAYFDESLLPLAIKGDQVTRSANSVLDALVNPVESMFGFVAEAEEGAKNAGRKKVNSAAGKLRISHARPSKGWENSALEEFFLAGDEDDIQADEAWTIYKKVFKNVKFTLLKEQGEPMKKPQRQEDHIGKAGFLEDNDERKKVYDNLNSATPNFYFFEPENTPKKISKEAFANNEPKTFPPQGAKFYLHNPDSVPVSGQAQPQKQPWKSRAPIKGPNDLPAKGIERKTAAPILRHGVSFDFHIDFDNLTQHELNILCFALFPSERFRHKIGLGKALGLGSIRIDINDLVLIDRQNRYTAEALFAPDPRDKISQSGAADAKAFAKAHDDWLKENDKSAHTALLALGETHNFDGNGAALKADIPVLWVPLTEERYQDHIQGKASAEKESFEWFARNDAKKDNAQKLQPIRRKFIPTLETISAPPSQNNKAKRPDRSAVQKAQNPLGARLPAGKVFEGSGELITWLDGNGVLAGTVTDDGTKKKFHVRRSVLNEANITKANETIQVSFTADNQEPTMGRLPPVSKITRI